MPKIAHRQEEEWRRGRGMDKGAVRMLDVLEDYFYKL
jgi:hypothetical protein